MGAYRSKLLDTTDIKGRLSRSSDHDFLEETRVALRQQIKPAAFDGELDRMARASGDFLAPDGGPLPKALTPGSGGYIERSLLGAVGAALGMEQKALTLEQLRAVVLGRYRKAPSPVRDAKQALLALENQRVPRKAKRLDFERQWSEAGGWTEHFRAQVRAWEQETVRLEGEAKKAAAEETELEEQIAEARKGLDVLAAGDEVMERRELEVLAERDSERERMDRELAAQNAEIEQARLAAQGAQRQAEQAALNAEVDELRRLGAKALKEARR